MILSVDLTWNNHINIVQNKTSKCLGIISKIRHTTPESYQIAISNPGRTIHVILLLGVVLTNTYCYSQFSPENSKKYCRLLTFSSFTAPFEPLFKQLKIFNIYQIYQFQLYMYRIVNSSLPSLDHRLFQTGSNVHMYDTRHKEDLHRPFCRTRKRQQTMCFQGPMLWNAIPDTIKHAPSFGVFKNRLRIFLNRWIIWSVYDWYLIRLYLSCGDNYEVDVQIIIIVQCSIVNCSDCVNYCCNVM